MAAIRLELVLPTGHDSSESEHNASAAHPDGGRRPIRGSLFLPTPRMYAVNQRALLNDLATFTDPLEDQSPIRCDNVDMLLPASHDLGASAFTWPAALFLWGPGSWSDLHRHHCVQLVMALDGTLRFRQRPRQRWTTCDGVLVRADAWHEVNARGTNVLIAFVDAESELGAALAERTTTDVAPIPIATVGEWRRQLGDSASLTAARVEPWVTGTLLRDRRPPSIDHRVKRVLRDLPSRLAEAEAVSLEVLAASVGLSASRFLHLFTTSVGVPLRPYVLWLRLQCGAGELALGKSVADAAYAAGFSDAAHFTRTFRRMIGATPRQILQRGFAARDFHLKG